jgi:signal transduction histidine kinase
LIPPVIGISYSQADEMNTVPAAIKDMAYAIISVSDNGIGFEGEHADKIFELFYRISEKGNYRGNGIGLAMCKKIMTMHGGFMTAEGHPAKGATFSCYFPLK